jgi:RNA polymerase sigma-70 factor (family 1)
MHIKQIEQPWVDEFRRGDEQALRRAFDLFYQPTCHFAKRLVYDTQAAEDIVSEVFVKIWRLRGSFEGVDSVRSYLFVAVRNACFNHQKKIRRENAFKAAWQYLLPLSEEQANQEMVWAMTLQRLYAGIEQLPAQRKAICKLIFLKGFNVAEVAGQLGISAQTVRNQKVRAIQQLRSMLAHNIYELCRNKAIDPTQPVWIPNIS